MHLNISQPVACNLLETNSSLKHNVEVIFARFDQVHPFVSGNKWYKLHFFLDEVISIQAQKVVTFGGAFSNHLLATATACKNFNIPCKGIVNGEEPTQWSPVLNLCRSLEMELEFIPRETFREKKYIYGLIDDEYFIPEGGFHTLGVQGAALMWNAIEHLQPTHLVTAVGTATTLGGLLSANSTKVIAVPVIKNMTDIPERLQTLGLISSESNYHIWNQYHFGGYAKFTLELIHFMNTFEAKHQIPLDKVYTAKMMYAVMDQIERGYFEKGSRIVCLHTGGLHGNLTLNDVVQ